jgi:selenoprotein W-related protein
MTELVTRYEAKIDSIYLIPSDGGKFEVKVDDELAYSKLQTGPHAESGEVLRLVGENL